MQRPERELSTNAEKDSQRVDCNTRVDQDTQGELGNRLKCLWSREWQLYPMPQLTLAVPIHPC